MELFRKTLPRRLIRMRELLRLSQKGLADRAAVGVSTVNDLESGLAHDANLSTILAVSAALGTTPNGLLGMEETRTNCAACGRLAVAIAELHEAGWSAQRLALRFGVHESSVEAILEAEYESRRRRVYRAQTVSAPGSGDGAPRR